MKRPYVQMSNNENIDQKIKNNSINFMKWLPVLLAVISITIVIFILYNQGLLLPKWVEWNEKENRYFLGKEEFNITLSNRITYATLKNETIWKSDNGNYISDYLVGDVDHDGENELLLLFWKRGSFGEHLPFWIPKNDNDWSQHIAVYKWKESYSYRLDPVWVTSKLGIDVASFAMDEDGVVTLTDKDGEKTEWYWRSWGLVLLKEGEREAELARTKQIRETERKLTEAAGEASEEVTISFCAAGDNLIHEPIYRAAKKEAEGESKYDFSYVYENVKEYISAQDLAFINVETLINDAFPPSAYPEFSTPVECGEALYEAGFRIFNLSNNHSYDQGAEGVLSTEKFFAGLPADSLATGFYDTKDLYNIPIYEKEGVKLAFLNYTYGTNGKEVPGDFERRVILLSETELIREQLTKAREQADFVIVSCHFGKEGSFQVTDEQRTLAKALCEWGADLIIGTHPHVAEDAQWFRTGDGRRALVCYSLGNFVSAMNRTGQLTGLLLSCKLVCRPQEGKKSEDETGKETGEDGKGNREKVEYTVSIKDPKLIPVVTVYGPYYDRPQVRFLSDYSRQEAEANKKNYRDSEYSYDRILKLLKENVSGEFLDLSGVSE